MRYLLLALFVSTARAQTCVNVDGAGHLNIPLGTTTIPAASVANCTTVRTIYVPISVHTIAASAFANCTQLESVTFAGQNLVLEQGCFSGCHLLHTLVNSSNITVYGANAFTNTIVSSVVLNPSAIIDPTAFTYSGCLAFIFQPALSLCNCTNCTILPNYNARYFQSVDLQYQTDCETWCRATPGCQGYIQTKLHVYPVQCELAITFDPIVLQDHLIATAADFTRYTTLECTAYTLQPICFSETQVCMVCPTHLYAWQTQVESGYTVFFRSDCCQSTQNTSAVLYLPTTYTIPVNNLTITSEPGLQLVATQCPLFKTDHTRLISALTLTQLSIQCANTTAVNSAAILIEYTRRIQLTVTHVHSQHALSTLTVLGGSQNHAGIIPTFTTTDLSGSFLANITATSNEYPIVAAISLASYTGFSVTLGTFESQQLMVIQPALNDNNQPTPLVFSTGSYIQIFNISAFTQVFGVDYEISFSHEGAFAMDTESQALMDVAKYQMYLLVFLVTLLFILHQDLFYYYKHDKQQPT